MMITLAVVECYDVGGASAETLYFSTKGWTSSPTDSPANTHFEERIVQSATLARSLSSPGRTSGRARAAYGNLVLTNEDGLLDYLLGYAFDGRVLKIYQGEATAALPDGFTETVFTMEQPELDRHNLTLKIADRQSELDTPLQTTKYLGNNVLPAGLEGVEDLEGKPKPLCFGVVRNISPPCVNTARLIYQVSDGAVLSVDEVRDMGIPLTVALSNWTDQGALGMNVFGLAYSEDLDLYVACGAGGGIETSPDGSAWTPRVDNLTGSDANAVVCAHVAGVDLFVVVANDGKIVTSPDGTTWTTRVSNFGADHIEAIAHNGYDLFVAAGRSGKVSTSPDGTTWTARVSGHGADDLLCATYGQPYFDAAWFVIGGANGKTSRSSDGITWNLETGFAGESVTALGYGYGKFWAASTNLFKSSTFGANWTPETAVFETTAVHAFGYIPGTVLAVGASGKLAAAKRGTSWNLEATGYGANTIRCMVALDDLLVIGGDNGIFTSGGPRTYASEAELLNDALAPDDGTYGYYAAGGYFRLGSSPVGLVTCDVTQGSLAADRSAAQLWTQGLTVGGAASPENIQDEDNLGVAPWGWIGGAGVVTPNVGDPLGGTDAYTVEDDGVVAQEVLERIQAFTGDGVKTIEVVLRENTMPVAGGQSLRLLDITMVGLARLDAQIGSWVAGEPQITMATGTLDYLKEIGAGYWRAGFVTTALVAANQNNFRIYPANVGARTGKIDIYRVRIYNSAEFSENWDFLNVIELDNANAAQCGQWFGPHEQETSGALSQMLGGIGAWWSTDREGLYHGAVLTDPSAETPVHYFTMDDVRDLERVNTNDPKSGLPSYRTIVRYDKNYTVQTTGLAADVRQHKRADWAKQWREAIVTDATVQTAYLLSQEAVYDSLLTDYADAVAEAARLQTLRGVRRDRYSFISAMDAETVLLDLGDYVRVTHDRFGLSAGQVFVVMGIEPEPEEGEITFEVWG